jgi:RNA polymerase sigma-70 factor (ECF subfamily)
VAVARRTNQVRVTSAEMRLIERVREGDREAFAALYERHVDVVRRYARSRAGCPELAEDLVSETFLRALRRIETFSGGSLEAWLTSIARNLLLDHYKSSATRLEVTVDRVHVSEAAPGPEPILLAHQEYEQIKEVLEVMRSAIDELSEDQARCLRLRFLDGCTIAETAAAMSRTPGAVKVLKHRAVASLRRRLTLGVDRGGLLSIGA